MTPNTTITLYATDFDISNRYVVKADSVGEALAAVSAFPSRVYTNCYWQRTNDFTVRATGNINEVQKYNYCVYVNNGQYNFAFITRYQYVNDDMTWIYLALDPWLNFAGKYVFHDSPMRRCHPVTDNLLDPNYIPEPVSVRFFQTVPHTEGEPATGGIYKVHLMTTVKTTSFTAQSISDYWDGIADLLQSYNTAKLISWSQTVDGASTAIIGGNIQANTSIVSLSELNDIVKTFAQNGQSNYLLGAYFVPDYFRDTSADGLDIPQITPKRSSFSAMSGYAGIGPIKWRKIFYSPQFRKFYLTVTGNTREIPADKIPAQLLGVPQNMSFEVVSNPGYGGNAIVRCVSIPESSLYTVESLTWDNIPISGFGVNANAMKRNILAQGDTIFNAIGGIFSGLLGGIGAKGLAKGAGVLGDIVGAAESGLAQFGGEALDLERIVKSGGVSVGSLSQSIATYNMMLPLITFTAVQPSGNEIERLNTIFGTYGYSHDGNVLPIVFGNYPYWNFYQTVDASITGQEVPQEYLYQVIQMFNRGVFVFNDISNYKDFSKAGENHL